MAKVSTIQIKTIGFTKNNKMLQIQQIRKTTHKRGLVKICM